MEAGEAPRGFEGTGKPVGEAADRNLTECFPGMAAPYAGCWGNLRPIARTVKQAWPTTLGGNGEARHRLPDSLIRRAREEAPTSCARGACARAGA